VPINSRAKGARGERELAQLLTEAGYPARRGCQFAGGQDSPDVVCAGLGALHFESKVTERLDLYAAISQAERDAPNKIPLVAHKRNGKEWVAIIPLRVFLRVFGPFIKDMDGSFVSITEEKESS
jgi:Holliday junction resolvase